MQSLYSSNDFKRPFNENQITEQTGVYTEFRTPGRQDYGRIVHSHAFRRLQGKTQLFPGMESDFFRNRLTHSLEVAQISKSIALFLNKTCEYFIKFPIDIDIMEVAGLAHDLGHPPFGHNGEQALFEQMKDNGGFEGNAQTLRLLTRIEKKIRDKDDYSQGIDDSGEDKRRGLNLTYRSLASILKYDNCISDKLDEFDKGYYRSEQSLVIDIKKNVTGIDKYDQKFKTLECYIMEIADDIAYATYDLEDALKCNLITLFELIEIDDNTARKIAEIIKHDYDIDTTNDEIRGILRGIYCGIFSEELNCDGYFDIQKNFNLKEHKYVKAQELFSLIKKTYNSAKITCENGYYRTQLTSRLIKMFITGVEAEINYRIPALSKAYLKPERRLMVESLKLLSRQLLISSPGIRMTAIRGKEIVTEIFKALTNENEDGYQLLPEDYRELFSRIKGEEKRRIICDFVAGMTDRYALEFYGRLFSEDPETIFKKY